jgi:hypothetical protein
MLDLQATFEKFDDEFLKFKHIPESDRLSNRPDLHAFLLLDRLCPGSDDMVSAAEHDEIWLDVDVGALARVATEDNVLALVRCGVRYDDDVESLALFV